MIEHVLDLGNQLKKELETSTEFVIDSYKDLLIVGTVSYTHLTLPTSSQV